MPRTKLKKTATKRNRNSASEDLRVNAVADLDKGNLFFGLKYLKKKVE